MHRYFSVRIVPPSEYLRMVEMKLVTDIASPKGSLNPLRAGSIPCLHDSASNLSSLICSLWIALYQKIGDTSAQRRREHPRVIMIPEAGARWFRQTDESTSSSTDATNEGGDDNRRHSSSFAGRPPRELRKRLWRAPMSISTMKRKGIRCCKTLRCIDRFANDEHESERDILRTEQEELARITLKKARTAWVAQQVPHCKMPRNEGSMRAGGVMVCNAFFCLAFGVSNTSIESAKGNPASKVMLRRYDISQQLAQRKHILNPSQSMVCRLGHIDGRSRLRDISVALIKG